MMQLQLTQGSMTAILYDNQKYSNIAEADSFIILSSTHMKTDQ